MIEYLETKLGEKDTPRYVCKEIFDRDLESRRIEQRLEVISTVDGSSMFQVKLTGN